MANRVPRAVVCTKCADAAANKGRKVGLLGGLLGGAGIGVLVLNPVGLAVLSAAGFTSIGPAAGSIAAAWMSSSGGVAAGSLYALLQSTAMTGGGWLLGTASTSCVGAAGGGLAKWCSSKLRRTTTSSSKGCDPGCDVDDPGCDVEEKSQERCVICGAPVAAETSPAP